ncbi:ExbD/TolR family protein [Oceanospirillum sediminis]|uniref:Biopolymer transporter ExbD n=1 Tax=Oceanospirillum sediminis TaxID=2760088 RepID=A0A839IRF4_9GAMM|nr:biopolymer transporter ExbD [Oceanospirillum sediminis]
MKFRRSHTEPVSLNMTPLIDVVFLLLIFFMVSTTFDRPSELKLQLPEVTNGSEIPASAQSVMLISIKDNGQVFLNENAVTYLPDALDAYQDEQARPDLVRVMADERALHRDVSGVLDALSGAGLTNISFQTLAARTHSK